MTGTQTPHARQRLALATYVKLMRAANIARNVAASQLADSGLTLTQFAVLEALYHLGPMSLSEMAQKILTTGGNLTMVVGNLQKQWLVRRQRSPEDHRVFIVALTTKGRQLIRRQFPQHAAAIVGFLSVLTPEEQMNLGELCRKLGKRSPARTLQSEQSPTKRSMPLL